jgi:hypothetical protein
LTFRTAYETQAVEIAVHLFGRFAFVSLFFFVILQIDNLANCIMTITELIQGQGTAFSFEVLPPKKGEGIEELERTVETLLPYGPKYINITTHHSEPVYKRLDNGLVERLFRSEDRKTGNDTESFLRGSVSVCFGVLLGPWHFRRKMENTAESYD